MPEPLIRLLAELPPADPDPARAERTSAAAARGFGDRPRAHPLRRYPPRAAGRPSSGSR